MQSSPQESVSRRIGRFFSNLFHNRSGQRSENHQISQTHSDLSVSSGPGNYATQTVHSQSNTSLASERSQCLPPLLQSRRSSGTRRYSNTSSSSQHNTGSQIQFTPPGPVIENDEHGIEEECKYNAEIGNNEVISAESENSLRLSGAQSATQPDLIESEPDSNTQTLPESSSTLPPQSLENPSRPPSFQPPPQLITAMVEALLSLEMRPQSRNGERSNSRLSRSDTPIPDNSRPPSRNMSLRLRIPPNSFENVVGAVSQATSEISASRSTSSFQTELLRELRRQGSTLSDSRSNYNATDGRSESQTAEREDSRGEPDDGTEAAELEFVDNEGNVLERNNTRDEGIQERLNENETGAGSTSSSDDGAARRENERAIPNEALDAFASILALMIGDSLRRRVQELTTESNPPTEGAQAVDEDNSSSERRDNENLESNSNGSNENNQNENTTDNSTSAPTTEDRSNAPRMRVFPSGSGPEHPFFFVVYIPPNTMILMTMRGGLTPQQSLQGQPPASATAISELVEINPALCVDEKCLICQEEFSLDEVEPDSNETQQQTQTRPMSADIDLMALFTQSLQNQNEEASNETAEHSQGGESPLPDESVGSLQQEQPPSTFEASDISDSDNDEGPRPIDLPLESSREGQSSLHHEPVQNDLSRSEQHDLEAFGLLDAHQTQSQPQLAEQLSVHPNILETAHESNPVESDDLTITTELTTKGKEAEPTLKRRKILSMPCKHFFHADELIEWLKFSNTCPVCRYELLTDNEDYNKLVIERMSAREKDMLARRSTTSTEAPTAETI